MATQTTTLIEINQIAVLILVASSAAGIIIEIVTFQNDISIIGNTAMFMAGIVFGISGMGLMMWKMYEAKP